MSNVKVKLNKLEVQNFLQRKISATTSDVEFLSGGEVSQAYGYSRENKQFVIRFNPDDFGFKKDLFSYKNFSSPRIPIPKVHRIGKYSKNLWFSISARVSGNSLDSYCIKTQKNLLPKTLRILNAIHESDVTITEGYGEWDTEGKGDFLNWKLYIKSFIEGKEDNEWINWPKIIATTFFEKDLYDFISERVNKLVRHCPEERYLLHGDYSFDNIGSDGSKITGIFDWADSMYGDFLFDVARLDLFMEDVDIKSIYLKLFPEKKKQVKFNERWDCYMLIVYLDALGFYAKTNQKEKYDLAKGELLNRFDED